MEGFTHQPATNLDRIGSEAGRQSLCVSRGHSHPAILPADVSTTSMHTNTNTNSSCRRIVLPLGCLEQAAKAVQPRPSTHHAPGLFASCHCVRAPGQGLTLQLPLAEPVAFARCSPPVCSTQMVTVREPTVSATTDTTADHVTAALCRRSSVRTASAHRAGWSSVVCQGPHPSPRNMRFGPHDLLRARRSFQLAWPTLRQWQSPSSYRHHRRRSTRESPVLYEQLSPHCIVTCTHRDQRIALHKSPACSQTPLSASSRCHTHMHVGQQMTRVGWGGELRVLATCVPGLVTAMADILTWCNAPAKQSVRMTYVQQA